MEDVLLEPAPELLDGVGPGGIGRELTSSEPNLTLGRRAWESIVAFATVEGTIQGLERISKALLPLVPLITEWYGGPPPLPPGMMA